MRLLISLLLFSTFIYGQSSYQKNYFDNGNIKSEGWTKNNKKIDYWNFYFLNGNLKKEGHFSEDKPIEYWYFYNENGIKQSEGHFDNGEKVNWWLFYDNFEKINHKCQQKHNQKNGYCLIYKNEKLVSAAKFKSGKKIKEWTDLKSFKKENNLLDLQ